VSRTPAAAVALVLAFAGCGSEEEDERKLDTAQVERGIADGIEKDRPGTRVVEVSCPDDIEIEKGAKFTCRVRGAEPGQEAIATVTQVDDEGRVRYRVPGPRP
jgi:hypothetical protein